MEDLANEFSYAVIEGTVWPYQLWIVAHRWGSLFLKPHLFLRPRYWISAVRPALPVHGARGSLDETEQSAARFSLQDQAVAESKRIAERDDARIRWFAAVDQQRPTETQSTPLLNQIELDSAEVELAGAKRFGVYPVRGHERRQRQFLQVGCSATVFVHPFRDRIAVVPQTDPSHKLIRILSTVNANSRGLRNRKERNPKRTLPSSTRTYRSATVTSTSASENEAQPSRRTAMSTATVRSCPATPRIDWRKVNPQQCSATRSTRRAANWRSSSYKTRTKWIWTVSRRRTARRCRRNPIWATRSSRPTMSRATTTRSRRACKRKIGHATAERAWTSPALPTRSRCFPPRRHRHRPRSGSAGDETTYRATTSTDPSDDIFD